VNGRITVRESYVRGEVRHPKSGKPREVALSDQARQALAAHRHARGERVFCDAEGQPFTMGRWRASWSAPAGSPSCARSGGTSCAITPSPRLRREGL
jgi:hypothetical protein